MLTPPAAMLAPACAYFLLSSLVRKIVDIIHPGVANVSKSELGEMIAKVSSVALPYVG